MPNTKQEFTIGDNIYSVLKNNIIELMIKPGETISIKDISTQLNVGRSPVRDALIKLEKEGLIKSMPQKGTMIAKIDMERVQEEQYLRECLEEKTIYLFMKMHEKSDIGKLKKIYEKQKQCVAKMDSRRFLQYDEDFHEIFYQVAGKPLCWQTIQSMSGHYRRIRLLSLLEENILTNVLVQHEQIITLIEENKTEELIELIHDHVTRLKTEELDLHHKYPELFENINFRTENTTGLLKKDFLNMIKK